MTRKTRTDRYVSLFVDRHGKERCRFRRGGFACYLPHPSSREYRGAYREALAGATPVGNRAAPRSVDDLVARFYRSSAFLRASDPWQATVRRTIEPFRTEFGGDQVGDFRFDHVEVILARKARKVEKGGRTTGGAAAAARLHEQLRRLFAFAIRLGWIGTNPAAEADLPVKPRRIGFHSWTEGEIARFQARWPLGTRPRLALELMLWTGIRRGDAVRAGKRHVSGERFRLPAAEKTGKAVDMLAAPPLLEAIEAMPALGIETLLVTDYGRPFTIAGFGNWFRDRCDEAGLPHCTAHGLRKALARRAADLGATQQQLKALGQWSSDRDVATYTAASEQRGLADAALLRILAAEEQQANIV